MILTLYKNCILNDNYNEVFDLTKKTRVIDGVTESYSVFTDYLKGLNNNVINLPNVYYSRNMSFTLGISGDNKAKEAFEYNYCKIEAEGIVRYCFITDIQLANSVATYYTEEDIWSNYAYDMQFRYGYLTNSRKLDYKIDNSKKQINYYLLPADYQSNDFINYKYIVGGTSSYNIICQAQFYLLKNAGPSNRVTRTVLLSEGKDSYSQINFSLSEIADKLAELQTKTSSPDACTVNKLLQKILGDNIVSFQIDNITIIPANWNLKNKIGVLSTDDNVLGNVQLYPNKPEQTQINFLDLPLILYGRTYPTSYPEKILEGVIENNFKIISFGTRTSQFEINMNGTSLKYELRFFADESDFKILLNFQNKSIDITHDFVYNIPFEALTSDIIAQRKIARNTSIYNGFANIASGTAQTALNASGIINKSPYLSISSTQKNRYGTTKRGAKYLTSSKYEENRYMNPAGSGSYDGIIGGVREISDGIVGIVNALLPKYTSNNGTFVTSEALLNAWYGLCVGEIIADNENFIENYINIVGYIVYEIIKDNILFYQDFTDYNICKFETVDIYGSFPQSIKLALENILTSGFKIWYNSELKEKIENADIQ